MSKELIKKIRVNASGHVLIYRPDHPGAYTSENWKGYVYEHRYVAEINLKRALRPNEEVHHLDGNPANNEWENLLVLEDVMHHRLHDWMRKSALPIESWKMNGVNSENSTSTLVRRCPNCSITLSRQKTMYCSLACSVQHRGFVSKKPPAELLVEDLASMNYCAIGRKYGVSDNAVRKWERRYASQGLITLSQARGTPLEGATTT